MAAKIIDITNYTPKSSDLFFFDNNIWMYLFCPLADFQKNRQKQYSSFLQSINSSRSTIFINSLILSEFSNRYLRMDFEQWRKKEGKLEAEFKKDYIGTNRYKDTVLEINRNIRSILKICVRSSDNFNAIDLDAVLQHLSCIDFNDSYYLEYAKLSKLKIVTDDNDFCKYTNHSVEIVTLP